MGYIQWTKSHFKMKSLSNISKLKLENHIMGKYTVYTNFLWGVRIYVLFKMLFKNILKYIKHCYVIMTVITLFIFALFLL